MPWMDGTQAFVEHAGHDAGVHFESRPAVKSRTGSKTLAQ